MVKADSLDQRIDSDLDTLKKMRVVNRNGRLDWNDEHSVSFHSQMNLVSNRLMNHSFIMEKKKQKTLQKKIVRIASLSNLKQKKSMSRSVSFSDDVISFMIFNNSTMDFLDIMHGEDFETSDDFENTPREKFPKDCHSMRMCV